MNPNLPQLLTDTTTHAQYFIERIEAQLLFAQHLCDLHGDRAASWRRVIARARAHVQGALEKGYIDGIATVVAEAEEMLSPFVKTAKNYTAHCVGHAHIDMNWMWSWPETVSVTLDSFHTVLRLMAEYPSFTFSQSQASTYAIVERHDSDLLKRIAQRVKEGRWEVTASHWVEGDKNLASAESLCRQLLYTREYMHRLFGLRPEDVPIDWAPDTFGHAATMPTYLVDGGVKYLYLHRPGVHTAEKPGAFWWAGPDGSRVLVKNDMGLGYNGVILPGLMEHLVKFVKLTGGTDYMYVYGVGDHGGGPTRRDILRALDMDKWPVFPNVKFSTARRFYERLEKQADKLPVLKGELNTEFTGCYTTQTLIKRANRIAQSRLVDSETACALAFAATAHRYPEELLVEAWQDTLLSQFHDILPGSGVHDTRTYMHGLFQKSMASTSTAEVSALRRLAAEIDTSAAGGPTLPVVPSSHVACGLGAGVGFQSSDGGLTASEQSVGSGPRPLVIFNSIAMDRDEIIEATIWDNAPIAVTPLCASSFSIRLPDGKMVSPQVVSSGKYWGHDFVTLAFPVRVEGLGYAQYIVLENQSSTSVSGPCAVGNLAVRAKSAGGAASQIGTVHHCSYAPVEHSVEGLENEFLHLEINPTTGGIRSLRDKRSGVDLITPQQSAPALEYAVERPHGMSAWSIEHTGPVEHPKITALRRGQNGPFKATLDVEMQIHESTFTLTYEMRAGDPKLYVHMKGVWFQRGTPQTGIPVLRYALPLALDNAQARYEIPFGAIDRSLNGGEELPALQWVQVSGKIGDQAVGCLLLNDSKHGHSLDGSTLRLTLIRSSYDPDILPEIGQHEIHLALCPFAGKLPVAEAIRTGEEFNRPLRVIGTDIHKGGFPADGRFISIKPTTVILSAIKKAENGDALVLRLFNPNPKNAMAKIQFNTDVLGRVVSADKADLLERPVEKVKIKNGSSTVSVTVPGCGIMSLLVNLSRKQ
jgi:alpha-mannosidase